MTSLLTRQVLRLFWVKKKEGGTMASRRGYYWLNNRSITKREASIILGRAYGMPQTSATTQFERLANQFFRVNPMATGFQDRLTGIIYARG